MRYAPVTERLAGLGGAKWEVHARARQMKAQGRDVIELTIGEPDVPTPAELIEVASRSMTAGRTGYSNGRGEPGLVRALSARYTARLGRAIGTDQIMCFPGTQTTLYAIFTALVQSGDEVLVGDPMYATYEGVIAATGATTVPVPLRPEHGFRMQAADVAARITPRSRVLFLNTPHNPTGAILRADEVAALGELARAHDLWIVSDEVYEDLIFGDTPFTSPLADPGLAERTIAASSISKSHASPGFRSGWCVGPAEFCARLLPLSETMLFGNQPFIADMTAAGIAQGSPVAAGMVERFSRRADLLVARLDGVGGLARPPARGGDVRADRRARDRAIGARFRPVPAGERRGCDHAGRKLRHRSGRLGPRGPDSGRRADRGGVRPHRGACHQGTGGMMTVGQALVAGLRDRGVEVVFGIPGVHTIELYRGLSGGGIRHVTARHEQGAAFMADGYARVSGKPGVAFVITGPGLTNALTAMAQAREDSVPILVISGVNRRDSLGRGLGLLHELPDQAAMVRALCPSFHVATPEALEGTLARAFVAMTSGRPGPVHVEIPTDVMPLPCPAPGPAAAGRDPRPARPRPRPPRPAGGVQAPGDPCRRRGAARRGGAAGAGRAAGRPGDPDDQCARADARASAGGARPRPASMDRAR